MTWNRSRDTLRQLEELQINLGLLRKEADEILEENLQFLKEIVRIEQQLERLQMMNDKTPVLRSVDHG